MTATPNDTGASVAASDPIANERCRPPASFMDELTEPQRHVLSAIACNLDGGHNPNVLLVLAARGLIVGYHERLDGFPPVDVVRWEVPLPVHIEWARWCAEQPDEEDTPS